MLEAVAPPQAVDLERAVLGAVLFENDAIIPLINAGVNAATFFKPAHSIMFAVMEEMREEGEPIDQLTLAEKLKDRGVLDQIGGEAFIAGLSGEITSSASAEHYAKRLRDAELRRREIALLTSARNLAYTDGADGIQIIETTISALSEMKVEFGGGKRGLTELIREFIESTTGNFSTTEVNKYLESSTKVNKRAISAILSRMLKEGYIERTGDRNGIFRKVDADCEEMDWRNADTSTLPVVWPFGIEDWAETMPKNIIVAAGEPNSGKTSFLLNTAKMNMHQFDVYYFSSEMGPAELKKRLLKFEGIMPAHWNVRFYERACNFADVIRPDAMNIIDFLEIHEDFWKIGQMLKDIHDRLRKGIAVIGLQKDINRSMGRGGIATLEKPRLYLSMSYDKDTQSGCCEIVKAKNWATEHNPNGMKIHYKLIQGAKYKYSNWEMKP